MAVMASAADSSEAKTAEPEARSPCCFGRETEELCSGPKRRKAFRKESSRLGGQPSTRTSMWPHAGVVSTPAVGSSAATGRGPGAPAAGGGLASSCTSAAPRPSPSA